jgi:heme-degrading monooxygenase HmoA
VTIEALTASDRSTALLDKALTLIQANIERSLSMQHLVTNWHVDRNRTEEWEAIWNQLHEVARRTPGFQMARLLRSVEHPGKYTVYSLWNSRTSWDDYYNDQHIQELTRNTFKLLKGPPIQEWFDLVCDVQAPE